MQKVVELIPLTRGFDDDGSVRYSTVEVSLDRDRGIGTLTITAPIDDAPGSLADFHSAGAETWMLRAAT